MPQYIFRADRGAQDDRFDAADDAAARAWVIDLLHDEGAEEGDGGSLYRTGDGGRGDEEFIDEVRLGDDDDDENPYYVPQGMSE